MTFIENRRRYILIPSIFTNYLKISPKCLKVQVLIYGYPLYRMQALCMNW